MNYYERHIGDYAKDTAHLSLLEHGAYTVLMDRYYATETPIPEAQKYRVARASTAAERAAVDVVLAEFFQLTEDGWRQKRCDVVIEKHHAFIEKQRANGRASAAKRSANDGSTTVQPPLNSGYNQTQATRQPPTSHFPLPTSQKEREGADAPPRRRSPRRSSRVPEDFLPDLAYAVGQIPDIDVHREVQKFRDWEFKTPKSDWAATWRNWIGNCRDSGKYAKLNGVGNGLEVIRFA